MCCFYLDAVCNTIAPLIHDKNSSVNYHSFNSLLVNKKLVSVNINVADLLNGNYILLLFVVLALGLCLGKLRLGSVQLGNSIGVLVVSLLLGQQHFSINTDALNLGFMLFIFCVGVEAGPNFFRFFFATVKII